MDKPEFVPTEQTGKDIAAWCESGKEIDLGAELDKVTNLQELGSLYSRHKHTVDTDEGAKALFSAKKLFLTAQQAQA
jgi:hypothetical protein